MGDLIKKIIEEFDISSDQVNKLKNRLEYMYQKGFNKLVENIDTNKRRRLDFITELNIIYQLCIELENKGIKYSMIYEEQTKNGSPDIRIIVGDTNYWIQIKRPSILKTYNINYKIENEISLQLSKIDKPYFYSLDYRGNLTYQDVKPFVDYILKCEDNITDGLDLCWKKDDQKFIQIEFHKPHKHITNLEKGCSCGGGGFIFSETKVHITNLIKKALDSMSWENNSKNINIIMAESWMYNSISIGNVLFGNEAVINDKNDKNYKRTRINNGILLDKQISDKLSSFIILKNTNCELIANYQKEMFVIQEDLKDSITNVFNIDKVYYNDTHIEI